MSVITRTYAPPNSMFVIDDSCKGIPPGMEQTLPPSCVLATSSLLLVGCLMFQDGDTEITLGPANEVPHEGTIVFDGYIETPNGMIWISTVEESVVAKQKVGTLSTRVRVWTNHPTEPDRIIVGTG